MQITVRITGQDEDRFELLRRQTQVKPYQLTRLLIQLGMDQAEAGADPLRPGAKTRLEHLMVSVLERQAKERNRTRARDFNIAAELVEMRAWLRTLGEILAPNCQDLVKEKVVKIRGRCLAVLEQIPHDAPDDE
jgi:hypothetical protein